MMELRMRRSTLLSFFAVLLLALAVGVQSRCTLDDPDSVVQALKFRAPEPPRRSLLRSVWRRLGGQYSCEVQGLLGQHIALSMVPEAIANHRKQPKKKALAMVFCGTAGVGKTYLEQQLRAMGGVLGMEASSYVLQGGSPAFSSETGGEGEAAVHKALQDIAHTLRLNPKSFIIIDEAQLIPARLRKLLFDGLLLFLGHQPLQGAHRLVDPRQAIFIFATNSGYKEIEARTLELMNSQPRNSLMYRDFEAIIEKKFLSETSSWFSFKSLIDFYVPFLPMTMDEAKEYIEEKLQSLRCELVWEKLLADLEWTDTVVEQLANQLEKKPGTPFLRYGLSRIDYPTLLDYVGGPVRRYARSFGSKDARVRPFVRLEWNSEDKIVDILKDEGKGFERHVDEL